MPEGDLERLPAERPAEAIVDPPAAPSPPDVVDWWPPALGRRIPAWLGPLVVAAFALVLARQTLLPGVGFWDTAEFQAVPPVLGTLHPTGFPVYVLTGWLASVLFAPFGDPAFRLNLFGAVCVAAAVGLAAVLVRQLTGRPWLALSIAAILFLTEITWHIASRADAHSLHLALVALLLVLLVGWEQRARPDGEPGRTEDRLVRRGPGDRWLIGAAAVYALAIGNHSLALLYAPGIALFVASVDSTILRRTGLVARCVLVFLGVVVLEYLELPLRSGPFRAPLVYGHPETLGGFLYVVLAEQFRQSLGSPFTDLGDKFRALVDLAAAQLGLLAPLVPAGLIATGVRRPRYLLLTLPTLAITCFFAASYNNADISRYYLGPLLIALTWVALLVEWIIEAVGRALRHAPEGSTALRVGIAPWRDAAVELALAIVLIVPAFKAAEVTKARVDLTGATFAQKWLDQVLAELQPNAVVISWWSYSTPLWYARDVTGRRQDITIIDDRTRLDEGLGDVSGVIDSYLGQRPVYIIRQPSETARLAGRYRLLAIPDFMDAGVNQVLERRTAIAP